MRRITFTVYVDIDDEGWRERMAERQEGRQRDPVRQELSNLEVALQRHLNNRPPRDWPLEYVVVDVEAELEEDPAAYPV